MIRKKGKEEKRKKRSWEVDQEEAESAQGPSETYLELQRELEEKEAIKKANEEVAKATESEVATKALEAQAAAEKITRGRVFLDIEIATIVPGQIALRGEPLGRITFETFDDEVPRTAKNFRALCVGAQAADNPEGLCYRGNVFHRVVPGFMAQGGDVTREDGTGGRSIYGDKFEDENLRGKHDRAGLLSMANSGPNTNNSQFFVTTGECSWLNGKHVVFGRVLQTEESDAVLKAIDAVGTKGSGETPGKRVIIANSGELPAEDGK